jgi:hypothetical protein
MERYEGVGIIGVVVIDREYERLNGGELEADVREFGDGKTLLSRLRYPVSVMRTNQMMRKVEAVRHDH